MYKNDFHIYGKFTAMKMHNQEYTEYKKIFNQTHCWCLEDGEATGDACQPVALDIISITKRQGKIRFEWIVIR
jgi:hypothetical protein